MEPQAPMLKGYRVLDFTHFVAGPTCTRILGELGADVIKIERSMDGDHVRGMGLGSNDGMSTYYFQHWCLLFHSVLPALRQRIAGFPTPASPNI